MIHTDLKKRKQQNPVLTLSIIGIYFHVFRSLISFQKGGKLPIYFPHSTQPKEGATFKKGTEKEETRRMRRNCGKEENDNGNSNVSC